MSQASTGRRGSLLLLLSSQGFSLAETMIAMAAVGGFVLTISQMVTFSSKTRVESAGILAYARLSTDLVQAMTNAETCTTLFRGNQTPAKNVSVGAKNTDSSISELFSSEGASWVKPGGRIDRLKVSSIVLTPLTDKIHADPQSAEFFQYSRLIINFVEDGTGKAMQLTLALTVIKNSSNTLISCGPPQAWSGKGLGLNIKCSSDEAFHWNGVQFLCKKVKCSGNTVQLGLNADLTPNCVSYPSNCNRAATGTTPTFSVVYFNGSFQCKGTICPSGKLPSSYDADGFLLECANGFLNVTL